MLIRLINKIILGVFMIKMLKLWLLISLYFVSSSFSVNKKYALNCNQIENQIKNVIIGYAKDDYVFKSKIYQ